MPDINNFIGTFQNNRVPDELTPELSKNLTGANSLNMLNTRYIILDPNGPPFINRSALGNAWFVDTCIIAENADEEMSLIKSFNPSTEAIINKKFKDLITKVTYQGDSSRKIELKSYQPNELIYTCSSDKEGLVVFSEIYYPPGWKSFTDGKEAPYFKADYVLRGMVVPGGTHEIIFRFEPSSFITGSEVSLASSLLIILLCAGAVIREFLKKKRSVETNG